MEIDNCFDLDTLKKLEHLFDIVYKCRNAYFWEGGCAAERKWKEKHYTVPEIKWTENGVEYSAAFEVSCSRAYVYTRGKYYEDGIRTKITAIKASYKRMKELLSPAE